MTIGKLKQLIANLPDDAEVLLDPGSDEFHQTVAYVREVVSVKLPKRTRIFEADGIDMDAFPDFAQFGPPKSALIIE